MSVEKIMVNDHELTAFDLPPEPSETYTVNVDGLGEIVVEKGKPPKEKDVPAMYMRKLVPELCEQNAELYRENAKLKDSLQDFYDVACAFYRGIGTEDDLRDLSRQMRELGIGVNEWA